MAFDNSFLSPRGLLVNNNSNFVCNGPNFSKLQEATQATENLPYSDQLFSQKIGFSDLGSQEIYVDIIIPLIQDFFSANQIFDALARLYDDEANNETLRNQVQRTMRDRLDRLSIMGHSANATADILKGAIESVTGTQMLVKRIKDVQLDSSETVEQLRQCHEREGRYGEENFQQDLDALERLKKLIDGLNVQDDTQGSLENLQRAVGATVEIINDLTALSDYVAEHTEPGPGPLLNLEKAALLEMWKDLETEVQKFLDEYMS
ncbi:hypothetical protein MKX07_003566 [Trichoderma sp. CBMAI-0711]|nr:hypothetical protein MKX07_003566 [Trichoderma sp. CBMAI-0711]